MLTDTDRLCVCLCVWVEPRCQCDLSRAGLSDAAPSLSPCSAHYIECFLKMVTGKRKKKKEHTHTPLRDLTYIHIHGSPVPVTLYFFFSAFSTSFANCSSLTYIFDHSVCQNTYTHHTHSAWVIQGFNSPLRLKPSANSWEKKGEL